MTKQNFTSSPHYAKPFHVRVAFRVWLTWRNSTLLRACAVALPLGIAVYVLLAAVLVAW